MPEKRGQARSASRTLRKTRVAGSRLDCFKSNPDRILAAGSSSAWSCAGVASWSASTKATLRWEATSAWTELGRIATGVVFEQTIRVTDIDERDGVVRDEQGHARTVTLRRIRLVLDQPTFAFAAFPKGNLCLRIVEELGLLYRDDQFAELFPTRGQPAASPARLTMASVLQYVEGLSDRQAAAPSAAASTGITPWGWN